MKLHTKMIDNYILGLSEYILDDNRIHKPTGDHWDTFDKDYFDLISEPSSWENFRINGVTCMLETGLYGKDRKDFIKNKKLYDENYSDDEIFEMKLRVDELENMIGRDFLNIILMIYIMFMQLGRYIEHLKS